MICRLITTCVIVAIGFICHAQPVTSVGTTSSKVKIVPWVYLFTDTVHTVSPTEIIAGGHDKEFIQWPKNLNSPGINKYPIWCHFKINNKSTQKLVVEIGNQQTVDIFTVQENKVIHKSSSIYKSFYSADLLTNRSSFLLDIPQDSTRSYYLNVITNSGVRFTLTVYTMNAWIEREHKRFLLDGIYLGIMLIMIIYNLFIYFVIRDKSYFFYVMYISFMTLTVMSIKSLSFEFLWPNFPGLNHYVNITACLSGIFSVLFATSFLQVRQHFRLLSTIFLCILIGYVVTIAFILFQYSFIGFLLTEGVTFIASIFLWIAGFLIFRRGFKPAIYYLIAWTSLLISVVAFVLKDYNLLPYNDFTNNSITIGSALEAMLLSLALADRINTYKKEKQKAQQEALNSLKENQTLIEAQNVLLEKKVEERTTELRGANQELVKAFENLEQAQKQLIKSEREKMEANYNKELLELEAKALRAQMNPHFIFNCLNSIKSLIQEGNEEKSVTYLTTFSKLIRTLFNNADKKEITLYDEIETCKLYLQLEAMRFDAKFSYAVNFDPNIDLKSIYVPALIVQPFIENSIWHGIVPKEEKGYVNLSVTQNNDVVEITVDDNGIGREASMQNKAVSRISHQSKGVNLTKSRLKLDNLLQQRQAQLEIIDKKDGNGIAMGTTVILKINQENV